MDELKSILVVAGRSSSDGALLEKAVRLARGCGARIHLFYCDARSGGVLGQEKETAKAEQAWQDRTHDDLEYLDALLARARADLAGLREAIGRCAAPRRAPSATAR